MEIHTRFQASTKMIHTAFQEDIAHAGSPSYAQWIIWWILSDFICALDNKIVHYITRNPGVPSYLLYQA